MIRPPLKWYGIKPSVLTLSILEYPEHTTNNGLNNPEKNSEKILRHDQVLVVWNAPVPTAGRFPD